MMTSWYPYPPEELKKADCSRRFTPSIWRKAANLLGTTRVRHPGPFPAPTSRTANTSDGVRCSFPGQNGQEALSTLEGACTLARSRNWSRRLARSTAITTHSFVVGSCLSSGIRISLRLSELHFHF